MKVRNGFVSNSSSSSFIVLNEKSEVQERHGCGLEQVSSEERKDLLDFGFRYTNVSNPDKCDFRDTASSGHGQYLGLNVVCNQGDIFEYLIEKNISFIASEHYGDFSWYWDGVSDYMYRSTNYGHRIVNRPIISDPRRHFDMLVKQVQAQPVIEKVPTTYWTGG